jgi:hypothetical protein
MHNVGDIDENVFFGNKVTKNTLTPTMFNLGFHNQLISYLYDVGIKLKLSNSRSFPLELFQIKSEPKVRKLKNMKNIWATYCVNMARWG